MPCPALLVGKAQEITVGGASRLAFSLFQVKGDKQALLQL